MATEHETFAARWNRRKLEAKREADGATKSLPPADRPTELVGDAANRTPADPDPVDTTPMPTLDDVTPDGNVIAFLQKRVPAELQKLALRKAWTSDPLISTFVEIAENQYDWNTPGGAPGFGPLDPSWDLKALLAQATGATPDVKEDGPIASGAPDCDKTTRDELAEHPQRPSASQQEAQADVYTASPVEGQSPPQPLMAVDTVRTTEPSHSDMSKQAQRLAPHNKVSTVTRRHGGALPTFDESR
jgi:hypothetical protein